MPEEVTNDDNCVCALLSVNKNNDGDLYFLGDYCKRLREEELGFIPACSAFNGNRKQCRGTDGCEWSNDEGCIDFIAPITTCNDFGRKACLKEEELGKCIWTQTNRTCSDPASAPEELV